MMSALGGALALLGALVWRVFRDPLPVTIRLGSSITEPKAILIGGPSQGLFLAPDGSLWHWGEKSAF